MHTSTAYVTPPSRIRAATFIVLGVCVAALLAATALALVTTSAAGLTRAYAPSAADGLVPEGASVTIDDVSQPAIVHLSGPLREALVDAAGAASAAGIRLDVTSGWRSTAYQRWLFDSAVETYGSAEIARQYVASADASTHVTGEAVDIGSWDAQTWLAANGAAWGLCRTYANEPWHFERATEPGGTCPPPLPDARSSR